jgi:hypothetical protein
MIGSEAFKPDLHYDIQTRQNVVDVVRKNGKLKVRSELSLHFNRYKTYEYIKLMRLAYGGFTALVFLNGLPSKNPNKSKNQPWKAMEQTSQ